MSSQEKDGSKSYRDDQERLLVKIEMANKMLEKRDYKFKRDTIRMQPSKTLEKQIKMGKSIPTADH
jgi:hypothetical protein